VNSILNQGPNNILDTEVRLTAFDWLSQRTSIHGDVIPRTVLAQGFAFRDTKIPLLGPQGIFKPKILPEIPLSITTAPKGPYDDSFAPDGFLQYKYRGSNPNHHENIGLRKAFKEKKPLIYFHGIVPGKYLAVWPVFIVADIPENLAVKVAVDDMSYMRKMKDVIQKSGILFDPDSEARRSYITYEVRHRLHQRGFREKVLSAYKDQCALCRLRHRELLDAA
jgi:putative restriction endonuclease